jgi:hypothetical protein
LNRFAVWLKDTKNTKKLKDIFNKASLMSHKIKYKNITSSIFELDNET